MRPLVRKTDCSVKIQSKHGLSQLLFRYKKRKWFFFGAILFILMMFVCDRFVWDIKIVGNETTDTNVIIENLKECGLKKGALRSLLDEKEIKNEMLIKMPELSWIWPDLGGSKVIVTVKEKLLAPEIFDMEDYKNIVASKDGVIESMIVKSGNPMVKIGDTVICGDVLVSGVLESQKDLAPRYVQADAEVYAAVWYEKSKAVSRDYIIKRETGRQEKKYTFKIGGLKIKLFADNEPEFDKYMTEDKYFEFAPFGISSGISVESKIYREVDEIVKKQSLDSVISDGVLSLKAEIEKEASPNSKLCFTEESEEIIDEDTAIVTVVAQYIENIAKKIDAKKAEDQ